MHLNLARKWRSQNFESIVGQDLAVRILKNSLFLGKFFPVYLLAGQHGCGKTTTARVFAAAVNCALLPDFQQNPKQVVPCGICSSCLAMLSGKHPDFIEIDAASHTGVDNVRQLLETASLMPLIGRKKIYLIDEAHMLSKSAFNAFLKMLEEPSDFVLFMLATTDEHKIIETVKSRCFQLFFQAVASDRLKEHLRVVCQQENIIGDAAGLDLIVKQSQGSVRDALNLVEQVFLSEQQVGKTEVLRVLGAAADEIVLELFNGLVRAPSVHEFMQTIEHVSLEHYNAEYLWRQLLELFHAAFWLKNGCSKNEFSVHAQYLNECIDEVNVEQLTTLFAWWCQEETVFLRTVNKTIFIQFFLVRAWIQLHANVSARAVVSTQKPIYQKVPECDIGSIPKLSARVGNPTAHPAVPCEALCEARELVEGCSQPVEGDERLAVPSVWTAFVQLLEQVQEPLVLSIFKQATVVSQEDAKVTISFAQRLVFLKDTLEQTKTRWLPLFEKQFGVGKQLEYQFIASDAQADVKKKSLVVKQQYDSARAVDISDKSRWPLANALLESFPGTVTRINEPVVETKKQVPHDEKSSE